MPTKRDKNTKAKSATASTDDGSIPVDPATGEVVVPRGASKEAVSEAVQVKPAKPKGESKAERIMRLRAELSEAEDDVAQDEAYDESQLPFAVPDEVPGDGGKVRVKLRGRDRQRWISGMLRLGHRDRR